MSRFRLITLSIAALVVATATACSPQETAPAAADGTAAVTAPDPAPAQAGGAPGSGDAAELDTALVELGLGGAAATTHAYAQACGADAATLDAFRTVQAEQATSMGVDQAQFDSQFEQALPLASRRVAIDDESMAPANRADTCETVLATLE